MNYQKIYDSIISKAKSENRTKLKGSVPGYVYYENHHILPKCLGGSNSKDNLVLLTAREHFICHKLLVEIYPKFYSLIFSLHRMMFSNSEKVKRGYKISSREYERFRINFSKVISELNSGKKFSEDHKNKIRDAQLGNLNHRFGKIHSGESKLKISLANSGKKMSEEKKLAILKSNLGRKNSEETKIKMSDSQRGRPRLICIYCNKEGGAAGMLVHHFENCVNKNKLNGN